MNTDYGFFQLFRALKSLRDNRIEPALGEVRPEVEEKLPQINFSLLTSLPGHQRRFQRHPVPCRCLDLWIAPTC